MPELYGAKTVYGDKVEKISSNPIALIFNSSPNPRGIDLRHFVEYGTPIRTPVYEHYHTRGGIKLEDEEIVCAMNIYTTALRQLIEAVYQAVEKPLPNVVLHLSVPK